MLVEIRDGHRRKMGRVDVDPSQRPPRIRLEDGREVFLKWDTALDDGGQLRRCIVCDDSELFAEKAFPQVTGFVIVLAFAGAVVGALGYATTPPVLITMATVLVLDVAILLFSRRRLVCYRCRTSYHRLPIARYHKSWDRPTADRYAVPPISPEPEEDTTDLEPTGVSNPT